jgi:hypothetical protein
MVQQQSKVGRFPDGHLLEMITKPYGAEEEL